MPAKPSGEIKTKIVPVHQKNGDIYLMERQIQYDPIKKYNKVLSSKLVSKIPKGEKNPVPTRPKATKGHKSDVKPGKLSASRVRVGMMDIVDHIGSVSGIDAAVYASTDLGTAQKIISIARYLFASNGQTLPGIQTWQFTHPLPYVSGISEDVYHDLFNRIGLDESLQQNFFRERCSLLEDNDAIAYDSTTVSTYSENQIDARYGFNKSHDGLKTVKLLTLYSINSRQPIAFTKQPGNLPDVTAIENALNQLGALGVTDAEIVTDNGYYSEPNLSEMLQRGFDFVTLAKTSLKWIRPEIDKHMEDLSTIHSVCPFDITTHGITVMLMHEFDKVRKYASHKTGAEKGSTETFKRRIYLHIYFNATRQSEDRVAFENDLYELKTLIENGIPVNELPESSQNKVKKYMNLRTWGNKTTVTFKDKACRDAYKYHGYFCIVSNKEKDCFEALRKYRSRETIESFFEFDKQRADGTRTRVWGSDTLRGRMFVQFVALCYYEYFSNQLRLMKATLGLRNGNLTQRELEVEDKLKSWMNNTPVYLQLQWFDTVEEVKISSELRSKRWNTEVTERDRLYLTKLGIDLA
ncbi:MAG TPA: transposase [Eubacterium sp.]|nr:transposase [Eubacterium sp.]